ncbi:MAG: Thermonuclease precursor [Microgenomates bacterium OLB22]|nr:MAG: Thermonuclease precursor [Microgenomates bacterium OLB22]
MRYSQKKLITLLTTAITLFIAFLASNPSVRGPFLSLFAKEPFTVVTVVDGDTIRLANGQTVRYIGINTPELNKGKGLPQCFAQEATDANKRLVLGRSVRLVKDVSETDKYGRLLRYVYVGDTFVNEQLVVEGYAHASTYPPDVLFAPMFSAREQDARQQKRGLWADGACDQDVKDVSKVSPTPSGCTIKGNITTDGKKIYHLPVCRYYSQAQISEDRGERWFCSEMEATSAGWTKAGGCP